ncbi:MAG: NADP-dependent malic enzyme [Rhodospirillaceae bacterium]
MSDSATRSLDLDSLQMHASGRPGKIEIQATKPLTTQRDLALAYSPGVAAPCREIAADPSKAYDYTAKGNLVAVISNGTAVLGLGDLGALASKPVMEGKAVLFKRFADVDGIDLEIDTRDVDEFINSVRFLGPSFGGINLEDIKAPECFIIEQRLRELMDIPVFHDDQHGTSIIAAAGLFNACDLTGRNLEDIKIVVNGAGAAATACIELVKAMGVASNNVIMCDSKGVIYKGRQEGMNQWKSAHAVETDKRNLADAMEGADAFFGLSVKGAVTPEMVKSMAPNPIIFAMANPDPEITPEDVAQVRDDVIMATGRSDYPNQINNVLGFPFIFRGALDVRATTINDEMKIAAARALADLAREDVPDEVAAAYSGRKLKYGRDYIIPVPFDPRLIAAVPPAVAHAAMQSGVARRQIDDLETYKTELSARLDPTVTSLQVIAAEVTRKQKRMVFAEGEDERAIRAAITYRNSGYGEAILVARRRKVEAAMVEMGIKSDDLDGIMITNAKESEHNETYLQSLYARLQRKGSLLRDCQRMVNQDRNVFAACMVNAGHADAMVTGLTRPYHTALDEVRRVIPSRAGELVFALTLLIGKGRTLFIADTAVNERPEPEDLAQMALQTAAFARSMGHEPRVAFLSYSNFGSPPGGIAERLREAVTLLEQEKADFEFDGEMGVDTALNPHRDQLYPFCRLSGPANILLMPGLHAANISTQLIGFYGLGTKVGPVLMGLEKPAQIVSMNATVSDIVQMALMGAHNAAKTETLI